MCSQHSPLLLPLTGWSGHECRNGSHHMVLSERRGVSEEGRGDHQTVWDIHQTGALIKFNAHTILRYCIFILPTFPLTRYVTCMNVVSKRTWTKWATPSSCTCPPQRPGPLSSFFGRPRWGESISQSIMDVSLQYCVCQWTFLPPLSHAVIQGHRCWVDAVVRLRKQWKNCWICYAPLPTCLVWVSLTLRRLPSQKKVERDFSLHKVITVEDCHSTCSKHVKLHFV